MGLIRSKEHSDPRDFKRTAHVTKRHRFTDFPLFLTNLLILKFGEEPVNGIPHWRINDPWEIAFTRIPWGARASAADWV